MSITYHIHTSYLKTTYTEEYTWQKSWWSRIHTTTIKDLITLIEKMDNDMHEEMRKSNYASEFKIIIAIIKQDNYESLDSDDDYLEFDQEHVGPNYTLTIQQIYEGYHLPKETDFTYNNPDIIIDRYELFGDDCYFDYKTADLTNV